MVEAAWRLSVQCLEPEPNKASSLLGVLCIIARPHVHGIGPSLDWASARDSLASALSSPSPSFTDWRGPHVWARTVTETRPADAEIVECLPGDGPWWQRHRHGPGLVSIAVEASSACVAVNVEGHGDLWNSEPANMRLIARWARLALALWRPDNVEAWPAALSAGVEGRARDQVVFEELGALMRSSAHHRARLGWLPELELSIAKWAEPHLDEAADVLLDASDPMAYGRWATATLEAAFRATQPSTPLMRLERGQWVER